MLLLTMFQDQILLFEFNLTVFYAATASFSEQSLRLSHAILPITLLWWKLWKIFEEPVQVQKKFGDKICW